MYRILSLKIVMKRVFLDIETSPNIALLWKAGYKINIPHDNIVKERAVVTMCWKTEHEKEVHNIDWDFNKIGRWREQNNNADYRIVKKFAEIIEDADEIVGHNIDRFDFPWLKGRMMYHKIRGDVNVTTVDTLKWARKMGLNSGRLDYLGKYLFGQGKISTSWDLWVDIVLDKDQEALDYMVKYCKRDVLLLQEVYNELSYYAKPKTHVGVSLGSDRWSCPHCGSENMKKNMTRISAAGIRRHQMKCKSCGKHHQISDKVFKDYLEHKQLEKERKENVVSKK